MARVNRDRFGNEYQLIGCKDKKGTGFGVGYLEIGGKLFKLEPSTANKEGYTHWIKVTKVDKAKKPSQRW